MGPISFVLRLSSPKSPEVNEAVSKSSGLTDTSSVLSVATTGSNVTVPSKSSSENLSKKSLTRSVRSAVHGKSIPPKCNARAATAKAKKQLSPGVTKDREQGKNLFIHLGLFFFNMKFVTSKYRSCRSHLYSLKILSYSSPIIPHYYSIPYSYNVTTATITFPTTRQKLRVGDEGQI